MLSTVLAVANNPFQEWLPQGTKWLVWNAENSKAILWCGILYTLFL